MVRRTSPVSVHHHPTDPFRTPTTSSVCFLFFCICIFFEGLSVLPIYWHFVLISPIALLISLRNIMNTSNYMVWKFILHLRPLCSNATSPMGDEITHTYKPSFKCLYNARVVICGCILSLITCNVSTSKTRYPLGWTRILSLFVWNLSKSDPWSAVAFFYETNN